MFFLFFHRCWFITLQSSPKAFQPPRPEAKHHSFELFIAFKKPSFPLGTKKKAKNNEPELTGHEMYLFFFVFAASAYAQFTRERDWGCVITRWYNNTVLSAVFTICRPLNWHLDLRLSLLYSKYFSSFSIRHTFMNRSGFTIYSVFHSLNIITVKKKEPTIYLFIFKTRCFLVMFPFSPVKFPNYTILFLFSSFCQ